ncbi:MAG: thioredoxin domain-containing protein [Candidatus Roseilinea sp.]|uniref:thioredoxin domain-containing protein n=1 Tax=Candidatus Roseilinea sp. TaxID=2838777 RepID=UPI00404B86AC
MPNQLAHESSPYLLQHANNPVDWHPWGEEALRKAREENKPIFLSIGYAACHWCHVMEHESFEDAETAEILNRYFVSIKVDREERPDLDAIYMEAVVGMTGSGGWPMSVWLTPDGVPFYAGTYFPKTPRYGMPSFKQVLTTLAEAWVNEPEKIEQTRQSLIEFYAQQNHALSKTAERLSTSAREAAVQALDRAFDRANGGWGRAPKYPQPMTIEFLLRYWQQTGDERARSMIDKTLTAMAEGGMYDQLGGGFHRYSTDARWLVPHFEKMLYDNSQLARAYLHAWQATGNSTHQRVAVETLDYVAREMTHPAGGFYSTQDADSEGEEGKFFVWSADEVWDLLGAEAVLFSDVYDVTRGGNWEDHNILHIARPVEAVAHAHGLDVPTLQGILAEARRKLFAAREQRVKPGRDEKVLTAWNGLMLAAFAEAACALRRDDYLQIAIRNADFLLRELRAPNGRLFRTWKDGHGAKLNGYLEDYTHLAEGLIALYQSTFDPRWFVAARELMEMALAHFRAEDGGFYDTSDDHEQLVTRPRDLQDNAVPSGNAMAAAVLLKLGAYTGEARYIEIAESLLGRVQDAMQRYPTAFGQWLIAHDLAVNAPLEIALAGNPNAADTQALLQVAFSGFRPNQVVALKQPGESSPIPLLEGREQIVGKATAYVCRRFACQMPVTEPADLQRQLQG